MNRKLLVAALVAVLATISPVSYAENVAPETAVESTPADIFTSEQRAELGKTEQKYEFQAEITRLMDILINSLYTNRDIFLRELISNAADALDKIRFIGLTNKEALGEGELADLKVKIKFDKEKRTLTLTDNGIGMTKDELAKNLGIVARSGTTEFVKAAASGNDALSLIGQFGVGFYSVYLAADKVTVTSKSNDDDQYVWESNADKTFTIAKDPRGNTLGRGTEITLYLKADADEFLSERALTDTITKYSQFIDFPIILQVPKTVTEEVEVDDDSNTTDDVDVSEDKPKKTEKVTRQVIEDQQLNTNKAIWMRSATEVSDEEYDAFYKALSKDTKEPLRKLHFSAEGDLAFKSILFIPSKAPYGLYDKYYDRNAQIKLYVRRVMISDDWKDLLPRYLNFVSGVVDSDDLPLNVNREHLSQSKLLKTISKKVQRKVFEMLKKLADEERRAVDDAEEGEEDKAERKYTAFWKEFGKSIKLGVIEDHSNRSQLTKLLRFKSSKSGDQYVSLEDYVEKMKEGQKNIYYLTGESMDAIKTSPFLERAIAKGIEVLYLSDALDEYLVQHVTEFDGHQLQSLAKDGVELGGEKKNLLKQQEKAFSPLSTFLKDLFSDKLEKVSVSQRLAQSPMVVVSSKYGWSANMERIMKSQAFGDAQNYGGKKTLEINPYHPIIQQLNKQVESGNGDDVKDIANLLFDSAYLQSGFSMEKTEDFAQRVQRVVATALNVDPAAVADAEPEDDIEADETEEEVKAEEVDDGNRIKLNPEDIKISYGNEGKDEL